MTPSVWIIGREGLLGSWLTRTIDGRGPEKSFIPPLGRFAWKETALLHEQLARSVDAFAQFTARSSEPWTVYWAAGPGIMSTPAEELTKETDTVRTLLALLDTHPVLKHLPGTVAFASSAGGIYAGLTDDVITERSAPAPMNAYGSQKLMQEALVQAWATGAPGRSALIARLSTLYGQGQAAGKKQGLLTHIARSVLHRNTINIFVPFDTIRDYAHVRDAAADIVNAAALVQGSGRCITKIVAAEQPTTIAEIIHTFWHITRFPLRVIRSANPLGIHYPRRICFRSDVLREARCAERTSLLIGIAELYAGERLRNAAGSEGTTARTRYDFFG